MSVGLPSEVNLNDWFFQIFPGSKLVVIGYKKGDPSQRLWRSSPIVMRICSSWVASGTGTVYVLHGFLRSQLMDVNLDKNSLFINACIKKKFRFGFPKAWLEHVNEVCDAAVCKDMLELHQPANVTTKSQALVCAPTAGGCFNSNSCVTACCVRVPAHVDSPRNQAPARVSSASKSQAPTRVSYATRSHASVRVSAASRNQAPARVSAASREKAPARVSAASRSHGPVRVSAASRNQAPARVSAASRNHAPARVSAASGEKVPTRVSAASGKKAPARMSAASKKKATVVSVAPRKKATAMSTASRKKAPAVSTASRKKAPAVSTASRKKSTVVSVAPMNQAPTRVSTLVPSPSNTTDVPALRRSQHKAQQMKYNMKRKKSDSVHTYTKEVQKQVAVKLNTDKEKLGMQFDRASMIEIQASFKESRRQVKLRSMTIDNKCSSTHDIPVSLSKLKCSSHGRVIKPVLSGSEFGYDYDMTGNFLGVSPRGSLAMDCSMPAKADKLMYDIYPNWSAVEVQALRRVVYSVPAIKKDFWQQVAAKLGNGHSPFECKMKYNEKIQRPKKRTFQASSICDKEDPITAKHGTLKRSRQVHEAAKMMDIGYSGDVFETTPYKKKMKMIEIQDHGGGDGAIGESCIPVPSWRKVMGAPVFKTTNPCSFVCPLGEQGRRSPIRNKERETAARITYGIKRTMKFTTATGKQEMNTCVQKGKASKMLGSRDFHPSINLSLLQRPPTIEDDNENDVTLSDNPDNSYCDF